MHKRRNKTVAFAAAVVSAVLVLTACSAGGGGTSSDGKTAVTSAGGKTVVTFWQQKFEDYQGVWFKKYVDAYNASQDKVSIDYQVIPADTWAQKLQAAQAAGKQPNVATTNYGNIAAGVADGKFAALDDYMPAKSFSDIKDNVASFVTIGGKHYAYPMLVEPSTVLYYNTDLVTAAGLDPKSPPTSWAQLIDWSTKLTSGDVKGMTIASTALDLGWSSWGLQYNACGRLPISDDWSKAAATDPCFGKLLDFYKKLYQNNLMPQQPKVGYADGSPYGGGEVAMMAGGSWVIGQLKKDFPAMLAKTMVAPFPSIDGDQTKPTATLGGWTLTLDSKAKSPQAAADFIQYLLAGDPATMADFFKAAGYSKYTVRTSVDEALAKDPDASADPFMKIISDKVVANGKQEPSYPWDVALAFGTAIESAMKGTDTVEGSLSTADTAINGVIQKQSLAGTAPKK